MRPRTVNTARVTVLPEGFGPFHADAAAGTMRGRVRVTAPVDGPEWVYDRETKKDVRAVGQVLYDGPARVQALLTAATVEGGGETMQVRRYLVAVPQAVAARAADGWVQFIDVDPVIDGGRGLVLDVLAGTDRFQRDLFVEHRLDEVTGL